MSARSILTNFSFFLFISNVRVHDSALIPGKQEFQGKRRILIGIFKTFLQSAKNQFHLSTHTEQQNTYIPVRNTRYCDVMYCEKGWHIFSPLFLCRKPIQYPPDILHLAESLF